MNLNNNSILVLGSSGLVGSKFIQLSRYKNNHFLLPKHKELDITKSSSIKNYLSSKEVKIIINFVGHTDMGIAEKEEGDKKGSVWKLNVVGIKNLAKICQEKKIFLIHISTDGIFPGSKDYPGPYKENARTIPSPTTLSWYGFTKLMGEYEIKKFAKNYAIIRISYPFGNLNSSKDFTLKTINYIKTGYKLFSNQFFTPTLIEDLVITIDRIIDRKSKGIYHVATFPLTTPFEFGTYLAKIVNSKNPIKKGDLDKWEKEKNHVLRPKFGGLSTEKTKLRLSLKFHNWHDALDKLFI